MEKLFEGALMIGARNAILCASVWNVRVCLYSRPKTAMWYPSDSSQRKTHVHGVQCNWEANNYSAGQKLSWLLCDPKVPSVLTRARHWPISWASLIRLTSSSCTIYLMPLTLILSHHFCLHLPGGLQVFPIKILYAFLTCPMFAISRPAHFILLVLISQILFGEEYK
jgi:hypothetical protein